MSRAGSNAIHCTLSSEKLFLHRAIETSDWVVSILYSTVAPCSHRAAALARPPAASASVWPAVRAGVQGPGCYCIVVKGDRQADGDGRVS